MHAKYKRNKTKSLGYTTQLNPIACAFLLCKAIIRLCPFIQLFPFWHYHRIAKRKKRKYFQTNANVFKNSWNDWFHVREIAGFFKIVIFFKRWVQHTCTVLSVQFQIITEFNAWLTNKTFSALHFRRFLLFENHVYYWHFTVQFNTSIACNCHWENVWTLCDCDMTWIGSDWIL